MELKKALAGGLLAIGCAVTFQAQAIVLNGGFETGNFTGWSSTGSVAVLGAGFGTGPTEGTFQGAMETAGLVSSTSTVESALGLTSGTLSGLGAGTAVEGAGIFQDISVAVGDMISFDWNFLTDSPSSLANDFGFVSFGGSAATLLADTNSPLSPSGTPAAFETGFSSFDHTFTTAGTVRLGFGVMDVLTSTLGSALLVDNVLFIQAPPPEQPPSAIPEPSTLLLMSLGLLGLGYKRRNR